MDLAVSVDIAPDHLPVAIDSERLSCATGSRVVNCEKNALAVEEAVNAMSSPWVDIVSNDLAKVVDSGGDRVGRTGHRWSCRCRRCPGNHAVGCSAARREEDNTQRSARCS